MDLYIQIRNGQPYEHPIMGDNFRDAFPHIDVNNLPPEFAKFERLDCPFVPSVFQIVVSEYRWDGNVVKDYWSVRDMTEQEKAEKRQAVAEHVLRVVQTMKSQAYEHFQAEQDPHNKQVWQQFMAALNTWVLVNPLAPNIPMSPTYGEDGLLFLPTKLPVSSELSGSAPNVIG